MFKNYWFLLRESIKEWSEDKASRHAAALAYYTVFSLAPILVIAIAIAGSVFGQQAAQGAIVHQIAGLVGQQGAEQVQTMIQNASRPGAGTVATITGIVLLLFGASGVFTQLQDAMDTIWEVRLKPGRGMLAMIKERFLSFAMVLAIGFLLLVSLVITSLLTVLGTTMTGLLPGSAAALQWINLLVSFLVIAFLFALMFKYVPDARIGWKEALLGGLITSLLFTVGKMLIGIYLGRMNTSIYGVAGSLIVILLWVYYSGQILFLGAEFTQVFANRFGHGIQPVSGAERVTEDDRIQQGIPHEPSQAASRAKPAKSPIQDIPETAHVAVPSTSPRLMTSPVPVTGQAADGARERVIEEAVPALVALMIGLVGSLAIAREQRKRPIIHKG